MNELPTAVVRIPTQEESDHFLDFVGLYGYKFFNAHPQYVWKCFDSRTAYSITGTGRLFYSPIEWYLDPANQEFLESEDGWPKDPLLRGCSVDEYIAYVTGDDLYAETDIQFGTALAELL